MAVAAGSLVIAAAGTTSIVGPAHGEDISPYYTCVEGNPPYPMFVESTEDEASIAGLRQMPFINGSTGNGCPYPELWFDDQGTPVDGKSDTTTPPSSTEGIEFSGTSTDTAGTDSGTTAIETASVTAGSTKTSFASVSPDLAQDQSSTVSVNAAASSGGYTCVKKTTATSKLVAYRPAYIDESTSSWEIHYIWHGYSIKRARYVSGTYTTQFEQCVIGGGKNKKFTQRMAKIQATVSINNSENRLIGAQWGTRVDNGSVSSALNFEVAASSATKISGSLPVSNGGHQVGNIGSGICGGVGPVSGNQVNAGWNMTYPGFGTRDFKGNVLHALYEFYQPAKTSFSYYFRACRAPRY